jgi:hypothetical protein
LTPLIAVAVVFFEMRQLFLIHAIRRVMTHRSSLVSIRKELRVSWLSAAPGETLCSAGLR